MLPIPISVQPIPIYHYQDGGIPVPILVGTLIPIKIPIPKEYRDQENTRRFLREPNGMLLSKEQLGLILSYFGQDLLLLLLVLLLCLYSYTIMLTILRV